MNCRQYFIFSSIVFHFDFVCPSITDIFPLLVAVLLYPVLAKKAMVPLFFSFYFLTALFCFFAKSILYNGQTRLILEKQIG